MGSRVYMRMWCASRCVFVLDWYMYRGLSRSGVSERVNLCMSCACCWEGCVVLVLFGALGEVSRWWAGWYKGWRFNVKLATYLVLLDVVGSGCGALPCRVRSIPTTISAPSLMTPPTTTIQQFRKHYKIAIKSLRRNKSNSQPKKPHTTLS